MIIGKYYIFHLTLYKFTMLIWKYNWQSFKEFSKIFKNSKVCKNSLKRDFYTVALILFYFNPSNIIFSWGGATRGCCITKCVNQKVLVILKKLFDHWTKLISQNLREIPHYNYLSLTFAVFFEKGTNVKLEIIWFIGMLRPRDLDY